MRIKRKIGCYVICSVFFLSGCTSVNPQTKAREFDANKTVNYYKMFSTGLNSGLAVVGACSTDPKIKCGIMVSQSVLSLLDSEVDKLNQMSTEGASIAAKEKQIDIVHGAAISANKTVEVVNAEMKNVQQAGL